MSCSGTSVESLRLLKEYTELKSLIEAHKRKERTIQARSIKRPLRNVRPMAPFSKNLETCVMARNQIHCSGSKSCGTFALTSNISTLRKTSKQATAEEKRQEIIAKHSVQKGHGVELVPTLPRAESSKAGRVISKYKVVTKSFKNLSSMPVNKPPSVRTPARVTSKYTWHHSFQARDLNTCSSSSRSNPARSQTRLKTITYASAPKWKGLREMSRYKITNIKPRTRSTSSTKMRQVKKYSVKYVPVKKSVTAKKTAVKQMPVIDNRRYVRRRQKSVSQNEHRPENKIGDSGMIHFVVIGNLLYKSSKTKLARTGSAKMSKTVAPVAAAGTKTPRNNKALVKMKQNFDRCRERIISVRGVRFSMDSNRKTLRRLFPCVPTVQTTENSRAGLNSAPLGGAVVSRVDIGGETYIQTRPGVLVRSSCKQLRSLASRVIHKSIHNLTLSKQKKSSQFCLFYNKFGRCAKQDKGLCRYIHDADKIAICKRFLRGDCMVENCKFSHKLCPTKMPVCNFFRQGRCCNSSCPYRHVNVNPDAEVCPDFKKGYCPRGDKCKKWHVYSPVIRRDDWDDKSAIRRKQDKKPDPTAVATNNPPVDLWRSSEVDPGIDASHCPPLPSFISLREFDVFADDDLTEETTSPEGPRLQIKPGFVKG